MFGGFAVEVFFFGWVTKRLIVGEREKRARQAERRRGSQRRGLVATPWYRWGRFSWMEVVVDQVYTTEWPTSTYGTTLLSSHMKVAERLLRSRRAKTSASCCSFGSFRNGSRPLSLAPRVLEAPELRRLPW